jgi:hypothetical protein
MTTSYPCVCLLGPAPKQSGRDLFLGFGDSASLSRLGLLFYYSFVWGSYAWSRMPVSLNFNKEIQMKMPVRKAVLCTLGIDVFLCLLALAIGRFQWESRVAWIYFAFFNAITYLAFRYDFNSN